MKKKLLTKLCVPIAVISMSCLVYADTDTEIINNLIANKNECISDKECIYYLEKLSDTLCGEMVFLDSKEYETKFDRKFVQIGMAGQKNIGTLTSQEKIIKKGNPIASYYDEKIILPSGESINIDEDYIALFINGTFTPNCQSIVRRGTTLVPIRLISEKLGADVSWQEKTQIVTIQRGEKQISLSINDDKALINNKEVLLEYPAILYDDITYVPLRFIAENFDSIVNYSSSMGNEYAYYYDTKMPISPSDTIIRRYPNIIIDEKCEMNNVITKEEAMKKVQKECSVGLENFEKSTIEQLINTGVSPDKYEDDFKCIKMEIDRMICIGEVSRYYKYTIGPYDILFDKYNHNIFFIIHSTGTIVKKLDINDPTLFQDIFIAG